MTWKQQTERDCREWKLSAIDPHDRHTWRSGVRSAIHDQTKFGVNPLICTQVIVPKCNMDRSMSD